MHPTTGESLTQSGPARIDGLGQSLAAPIVSCGSGRLSNLDSTGLRVVAKGCTVEFPGGARAVVARVRLGEFWPLFDADIYSTRPSFTRCNRVRVVSS